MRWEKALKAQRPSKNLTCRWLVALHQASVPFCLAFALTAWTAHAAGPTPPLAPADPRSEEECRDYQRQQNAYVKALEMQNEQCHADALKAKSAEFVTVAPPCGGKAVPTPRQCQELSGAAWCASVGFASKYEQCIKRALAAQRKPFDDAVANNRERQSKEAAKLLREQCEADSALPKPEGCKALQAGSGSGFEDIRKP